MNKILFYGAILGLLSVLIAAHIDHGLSTTLTGKSLQRMSTAIRYHQLYAIFITLLGLIIPLQPNRQIKTWLTRSAYVFIIGIVLFSFSIYLSFITANEKWLFLTPVGGVILLMGWITLIAPGVFRENE